MSQVRDGLPLAPGQHGEAVADLQRRLAALGLPAEDPAGEYGPSTAAAVRRLQEARGLRVDGVCGNQTWDALVEAGYRLGDRLIYRCSPMLRGDDVADLQRRLSALGFDPGRIDGIFGDDTATALVDFQHNVALVGDGICGHRTIAELQRVALPGDQEGFVSLVRERLRLERGGDLRRRRVAVAESGGFAAGVTAVCRGLAEAGALPLALHQPDPSRQAAEANAAEVDCVLSLALDPDHLSCSTAYYRGFRYESRASRQLAELIQQELPPVLALDDGGTQGMALTLLRETRMPAVDIRLGAPSIVVQRTADVAGALVRALTTWVACPVS